jgi:Chitobiase/beta-hexosaminidase C-terminal domain
MSAIVELGGKILGSGGNVFATGSGGGGETPVFNFTSFSVSDPSISTGSTQPKSISLPGSVLAINNGTGTHQATGAFYNVAQVNIQSFTTNFTFQTTSLQQPSFFTGQIAGTTLTISGISGGTVQVGTIIGGNSNIAAGTKITAFGTGSGGNGTYSVNISQTVASESMSGGANGGISFIIQNTTSTTQSGGFGNTFQGDANFCAYGAIAHLGPPQSPCLNSVALCFEWYTTQGTDASYGVPPNFFSLNINGGPDLNMIPHLDLAPSAISIHNGNILSCTLVYDGTILTMTLLDTTTNAQLRYSWPINIPACTQQNTAWVGFGGGSLVPVPTNILSWNYSIGYNTRLATPTVNVTAGHYTSAQTVTISGPAGASIYYSTNGLKPTTSSTLYSSPITVSSSELLQAVAIQSGFTDSFVVSANYVIQASGPTINFPSGFTSASNLIKNIGTAVLSGSAMQLTDSLGGGGEAGAIWYVAPVSVSSFSTTFTILAPNGSTAGMAFVLQNQNQSASTGYVSAAPGSAPNGYGSGQLAVTGGPLAIGQVNSGLGVGASQSPNANSFGNGFIGLYNSVALALSVSDNTVGVYLNGAFPSGSSIGLTGAALNSGNTLTVALSYSGTTLAVTITDTVTLGVFSHNFTVDIPGTVGGSTAYAGVTAGNFDNGIQSVINWTGF